MPSEAEILQDRVLATAAEFVADLEHDEAELADGQTVALSEVVAELDD